MDWIHTIKPDIKGPGVVFIKYNKCIIDRKSLRHYRNLLCHNLGPILHLQRFVKPTAEHYSCQVTQKIKNKTKV